MAKDEVVLISKKDMLRALRNSYMQTLIESEINVIFFKWKEKHLSNGQTLKNVKDNLIASERNVDSFNKKIAIVDEMLVKL